MSYGYGNPVGGVGGVNNCVSPVGIGGCHSIGIILVLFILLVIISRSILC